MNMQIDWINIEMAIKSVYQNKQNSFEGNIYPNIDEYQFMEQAHVCTQILTVLSDDLKRRGTDRKQLQRINSLRDELEYPIMQMALNTLRG